MAEIDRLSIKLTADASSAKRSVNNLVKSLETLNRALGSLDVGNLNNFNHVVRQLAESVSALNSGTATIRDTAKAFNELGKSASSVQKAKNATQELANTSTALMVVGNAITEVATVSTSIVPVFENIKTAFSGIGDGTQKLIEDMGVIGSTFQEVGEPINQLTTRLNSLTERFREFVNVVYSISGSNQKLIEESNIIDGSFREIVEPIGTAGDKMDEFARKEDNASNSAQNLADTMKKVQEESLKQAPKADGSEEQIKSARRTGDALKELKSTFENVSSSAKRFGSAISGVANKVGLSALSFKLLEKSTRKTASAMPFATEMAKRFAKEITRVGKMLKLMVTRMALRKVISEVGDGFKSLALHSEQFNNSVSGMMNGAKKLGYSFAAMVSPLINALAPAIIYVINLLTKLANIINQVFSALTGATTFNQAKDFAENWADNIKAANKQAKELKKTVLGFDELNQMQDKTTSGGDTSGNIVDMFETKDIDPRWKKVADLIKKYAQKLFEPIKKAWEKVGDFVKKSWKYALDEMLKLGKSVARDFWKVWEQDKTQKIFENIFTIIGYIGVAVGNLAKRFREAWDKNETGLHILENIRDIVLIITEHFVDMAKATADWADNLDFSPLLESFNRWLESAKPAIDALMGVINDFYTKVILPLGEWSLEEGIPELIQVFADFNNKVEWDTIRERLNRVWNALEPFAETVGEGLIKFIDKVSDSIANFLNSDNWDSFIDLLEDWSKRIDADDVAHGLDIICKALIGYKALSFLASLAPGISAVVSALGGFASLAGALAPVIGVIAVLAGVIYSVVESYGGIENTIKRIQGSVQTVVDSIKTMTSDLNISKSLDDLKTAIGNFMKQLGNMKSFWEVVFVVIEKVCKFITAYAVPLFKDAIENIKNVINVISNYLKAVEGFATMLIGIFTLNKDKVKQGASELWEGVKGVFQNAILFLESLLNGFTDAVIAPFKAIKYALIGDPIVIDMWDGIEDVFTKSISAVVSFVSKMKDDVIKLFGDLQKSLLDIVDKIVKAFSKDKWTFSGVAEGLKKTFEDAKDKIKGVWNSIAEKLNGDHQIGGGKLKINLPKFAMGGFPEDDSIFMANSSEMLGKFSNGRNVVANNQQIVEGISTGVFNAVSSAMARNNNNGNSGYISNTIVVDGEVIARTVTKAQQRQNMRYSPSMG